MTLLARRAARPQSALLRCLPVRRDRCTFSLYAHSIARTKLQPTRTSMFSHCRDISVADSKGYVICEKSGASDAEARHTVGDNVNGAPTRRDLVRPLICILGSDL